MFGRRKSKKSDPMDPVKLEAAADTSPSSGSERAERESETHDIRPLYAAEPTHPSRGYRFSFDIDGPVPDLRNPIDPEPRRRHGAPGLKQDTD